ncbi:MAG TPA: DUF72 domain-containing protein, partial [Nitrospira sp.]|nr:DUF72 domain-containing protein [Nitrospira sp.]
KATPENTGTPQRRMGISQPRALMWGSGRVEDTVLNAKSSIRVGPAGWSYKDWEGIFYPPGMTRRKQHPLELVARCFDIVEINTSFYGHIKPEIAKLWARIVSEVNPDFLFTAKLHRSFTHSPLAAMEPTSAVSIKPNDDDERLAREGLEALAATGKFGALLIQFPVSFKNTSLNREYLETLLRQFIEYPRVVEVRHSTWNNPETIAYFEERNVSFCNIDQPQLGRSLAPTTHVTSSIGYVRLHGRNYDQWFEAEKSADRYNYLYKPNELEGWKSRVESIAEKAKLTFVVANNHFEAKAGVNALQMKNMLTGKRVLAPETLIEHYPELKKIADPVSEGQPAESLPLLRDERPA